MKTIEDTTIPTDIAADAEAVVDSLETGIPLDGETVRRIRQRAEIITGQIRQNHGLLDIGVPAIRELRGELPDP